MQYLEMKNWILRKLGEPHAKVNVTADQIYDRIGEAVDKFLKFHYNGTTRSFWLLNSIKGQSVYDVPEEISDIVQVINTRGFSANIDFMNVTINDMFNKGISWTNMAVADWAIFEQKIGLVDEIFKQPIQFIHNKTQHKIDILSKSILGDTVCLEVYIKQTSSIGQDLEISDPKFENVLNEEWVRNYALELVREQWGTNMYKFKGVKLLGDITVDGESLKTEAKSNIESLFRDLDDIYGDLGGIFWG